LIHFDLYTFGFAKCIFAFCLQLCLSMPNYVSITLEVMATTDSSDIHDHSAFPPQLRSNAARTIAVVALSHSSASASMSTTALILA
jgi:hypothetical protein